jgi:hypothetical protein
MRFRFAAMLALAVLTLSVMGANALPFSKANQPQVLRSERPEDAATADRRPHVELRIVNGFSPREEASIIAAVVDWNRTGPVRLNVAALNWNTVEPGAWSISKADDGTKPIAANANCAESGSIVVNVDRVADSELREVVAHEFARLFATPLLAHSPNGTVITR